MKHIKLKIAEADKHVRLEIKTQQLLANELMTKVRLVSPSAIMAGGAPRNWAFNRAANDFDIVLTAPPRASQKALLALIEFLGVTDGYNMATHNPDGTKKTTKQTGETYEERMEGIHSVFEGYYQGQKVQFIFIHNDTYGYMETHFDTSINMIYAVPHYNGLMDIRWGQDFQDTLDSGCIFVHIGQTNYSGDHLERMSKYFGLPMIDSKHQKEVMEHPEYIALRAEPWEEHQRRLYEMMAAAGNRPKHHNNVEDF